MYDGERWTDVDEIPTPREHLGAASDGRYLYAVGGRELSSDKNVPALERRRIGNRRWRNAHRLTPLVYVLGVIHTVGSGSDAGTAWMTAILIATGTPILYLGILRALPAQPVSARAARAESG